MSEQNTRTGWKSLVMTIAGGAFLLWVGWVSATVLAHSIALQEMRTWKENRPSFATQEYVNSIVLRAQSDLKDAISSKLDTILSEVTKLDKRVAEHVASRTP